MRSRPQNIKLTCRDICSLLHTLLFLALTANSSYAGGPIRTLIGHSDSVNSVAYSPNGSQIVTGSTDGTAKLWSAQTGNLIRTFSESGEVWSAVFSPDGTQVLTGVADGTVKLWDVQTGGIIRTFFSDSNVTSVAFSPEGTPLLTGHYDMTAKLWNVPSGNITHTFAGHDRELTSVAYSRDGTQVLTGSFDGTAKLWDTHTGSLSHSFDVDDSGVSSVAFFPHSTRALTGSFNGQAALWDTQTGELISEFLVPGNVNSWVISPEGARVLLGGFDGTAKLWDTRVGRVVRTFSGHTDRVNSVAFSPDGLRIVTGSLDGTAKLWVIADITVGGNIIAGAPGSRINVPISVLQLPNTTSLLFDVLFDPDMIAWNESVSKETTLLGAWDLVDANQVSPGRVIVSAVALSGSPASGNGTLLVLPFTINDTIVDSTSTSITFSNFADGLEGATSLPIEVLIDPVLKGDVDGSGRVTAADVQLTFEITLGRVTPTDRQLLAADVTGDGKVTAADVQRIFDATLGRAKLSNLSAKIPFLFKGLRQLQTKSLAVGTVNGNPGEEVLVPIQVSTDTDITAFVIGLSYDNSKLSFVGVEKADTLVEPFGIADGNEPSPGSILVSAAALLSDPISTSGVLIGLRFQILSEASGTADIIIVNTEDDLSGFAFMDGAVSTENATGIKDYFRY